ncbi:VOC family protein [Streptomyces hiroshimensis]|uniref:Uncharacterized protein n=1 Tax=Streptomyces hiroshimensis TaxID=66424 RepID=A0ABQ2Y8M5_9ACTN|nr:hypothetical protein [Streptomyces hiroshimensis]GGX75154.1 hypothetical protein GCM10010324_20690 [Streptomyces hiroshimensis]
MAEQTLFTTPMIYCDNALDALTFYTDALGAEELTHRRMLASHLPGLEDAPGMDRTVVYSALRFPDGSGLNVADRFEKAAFGSPARSPPSAPSWVPSSAAFSSRPTCSACPGGRSS